MSDVQVHGRTRYDNPDLNIPDIDNGTADDIIIGGTTPAAGNLTDVDLTGQLQGDIQNDLSSLEFGAKVLGMMTDPRLLNAKCEEPDVSTMIVNGDFTNWTGDNPDNWTILNEDANNYVTEVSGKCRIVSDNSAVLEMNQVTTALEVGKIYTISCDISNYVVGDVRLAYGNHISLQNIGWDSNGHHSYSFVAISGANTLAIFRATGSNTDYEMDNLKVALGYGDISGNGHHGEYIGSWTSADRLKQGRGWVLEPNGIDAYIDFGDHDDFSFGDEVNDSPFTMASIVEIKNENISNFILSKSDSTTGLEQMEWLFYTTTTEKCLVLLRDNTTPTSYKARTSSILSPGLYLCVATYDGRGGTNAYDGLHMYVDGILDDAVVLSNGAYTAMHNTTSNLVSCTSLKTSGLPHDFSNTQKGFIMLDGVEWSAEKIWQLWQAVLEQYSENGTDLS